MLDYSKKDSIVALATPAGHGSISVIRLSGQGAESIIRKCASFLPQPLESHRVYYGYFHQISNPEDRVDEVMIAYFKEGKSFSGEHTFEVSCHGSAYLVSAIIEILIKAGARMADKGEFTFRAFMNGRIDLTQAESVLSLIQSDSERASRQALNQLGGGLRETLERLESDIIYCLANIEASIDFSTEGLDTLNVEDLTDRMSLVERELIRLISSYTDGRKIKDGYNLVLVGQPNVGKSSLLNALLGEEKAIVTPVAGTTRDIVTDSLYINGYKLNLFDTAGLRDTVDQVEQIGISRAKQALSDADGILLVCDSNDTETITGFDFSRVRTGQDFIVVGNKSDTGQMAIDGRRDEIRKKMNSLQPSLPFDVVVMSALSSIDVDGLKSRVGKILLEKSKEDHAVISNLRHLETLQFAAKYIQEAIHELNQTTGVEFVSIPLKEALLKLQSIIGKYYDDQILDRVFKEFCLGK